MGTTEAAVATNQEHIWIGNRSILGGLKRVDDFDILKMTPQGRFSKRKNDPLTWTSDTIKISAKVGSEVEGMIRMDQYGYIRTAHRVYKKSIKQICRETGHSR